jgi:hypothetical protein
LGGERAAADVDQRESGAVRGQSRELDHPRDTGQPGENGHLVTDPVGGTRTQRFLPDHRIRLPVRGGRADDPYAIALVQHGAGPPSLLGVPLGHSRVSHRHLHRQRTAIA